MRENNIPLTRESYMNLAHPGNPPEEQGAEEEAALPEEIRKW
jgi:hypothetical protein